MSVEKRAISPRAACGAWRDLQFLWKKPNIPFNGQNPSNQVSPSAFDLTQAAASGRLIPGTRSPSLPALCESQPGNYNGMDVSIPQ
jgi:hypothetical protein